MYRYSLVCPHTNTHTASQKATKHNMEELEFVLIDAARSGVMTAIAKRISNAVDQHFNQVVAEGAAMFG